MVNAFTKRNHYNPCFWTACWNPEYFESLISGQAVSKNARDQSVFVLNLRSGNIYQSSVDRIHLDKDLGIAELTPDSMKDFCRRHSPAKYEDFCRSMENETETLYMDFEDILTHVEGSAGYDSLMEAVRTSSIQSVIHKGFLTCLLIMHAMRSHEVMCSMINTMSSNGIPKWEYFWMLKNAWGDKFVWARAGAVLALSRWTLYVTEEHRYPLCDSPVMVSKNTMMVVLSPRLLLEINLNERTREDFWVVRKGIHQSKFLEFRRRAIGNSFKEIIFHDRTELEMWRQTVEFKTRSASLGDPVTAAKIRGEACNRVWWAISGFDRLPDDFEQQIAGVLET